MIRHHDHHPEDTMAIQRFAILLPLLLLAFAVSAQPEQIAIEVTGLVSEVEVGGTARFVLTITNLGQERDVYRVTSNPFDISPFSNFVQYVDVDPNQIKLSPGQSEQVNVTIKILDNARPDEEFETLISIKSLIQQDIMEDVPLAVYVVPKKDIINIAIDTPPEVEPGDNFAFTVTFKNRLDSTLQNLEATVYSDLPGLSETILLNFEQKEQLVKEFIFPIRIQSSPGSYGLHVKLYEGKYLKGSATTAFTVIGRPLVDEKRTEKGGFLKSEMTIIRKNTGNTKSSQQITVETSFLKSLFTNTSPEPIQKDGNYIWTFELEPQEEYTVIIERNYRMLFYGFLIVVLAIIILYFHIERSVTIKKRIFKIKAGTEGITELKILLVIRNGKSKPLEGVRVMDILPNFLQPTYEFGTLKADKVQQGLRGKRFVWDIGTFQPGEERVFTYRVKTKINMDEGSSLPPATLHYMSHDKLVTITSGRLEIATKTSEPLDSLHT